MAPQISRLSLAFGLLILAFVAFRSYTVPEGFGSTGHHRLEAPEEIASLPMIYAGMEACSSCHQEVVDETPHVVYGVSCEACHGPSLAHTVDYLEVKPQIPDSREFCGQCHATVAARRPDFPTVPLKEHYPTQSCTSCHVIHH
jgi:hypothetical protein